MTGGTWALGDTLSEHNIGEMTLEAADRVTLRLTPRLAVAEYRTEHVARVEPESLQPCGSPGSTYGCRRGSVGIAGVGPMKLAPARSH